LKKWTKYVLDLHCETIIKTLSLPVMILNIFGDHLKWLLFDWSYYYGEYQRRTVV